jgi:hypothetical protein
MTSTKSAHSSPFALKEAQKERFCVAAQTLFPIKPDLDLFSEVGRRRFPVFHQRLLNLLIIRVNFV